MKAFRFPLERALHWRRTQLEIEKTVMQKLLQRRHELEDEARALEEQRIAALRPLSRTGFIHSHELITLSAFQTRIATQKTALAAKRKDLERDAAAQLVKTTEAQRSVRLLERLREKRVAEWTAEMNGEQERFAAEAWLGRWPMLKQEDDGRAANMVSHTPVD